MINTQNVSLLFGTRKLFEDVNIQFIDGNCYGVIGANGAGKSTFLKILSKEQEPTNGAVSTAPGQSLSILRQDHFRYREETVLQTVIMGDEKMYAIMTEKDAIYSKADFSDEDGIRAAQLESDFASAGGWEAETNAATLLKGLGISDKLLHKQMKELKDSDKMKVLLAQALFGKPDNLLLDEPTNHLDTESIRWLENYLMGFNSTVIVVSHDRHFLNKICTHMVDIDYGKVSIYVGNYDFWQQSSQLAHELRHNENKKKEEKAAELEAFIRRFSANASKSKQATSRKRQLEKLTIDELPLSTRKHPNILFSQKREAGEMMLEVKELSKSLNGQKILNNVSFSLKKGDKALLIGEDEIAKTALLQILSQEMNADEGSYKWGTTISLAFLPKDHGSYFDGKDLNLIDWLREYSEDKSENFIRTFLGRMLFSGDETLKKVSVLSGGEKVRCMIARMMLLGANVLVLDGPTNHLDLESITALNNSLIAFPGTILFSTHDQYFAQTLGSRVLELKDGKIIDHQTSYAEFVQED